MRGLGALIHLQPVADIPSKGAHSIRWGDPMVWVAAAIVFVALLYLYPRWTAYGVLASSLIAGAVVAYRELPKYLDEYLHNVAEEKVEVTFQLDPRSCPQEDFSLYTRTFNRSDRVVNVVRFSINAKRQGYSRGLGYEYYSDKILQPGGREEVCNPSRYGIPDDELILEFIYKSVEFQP